MHPSRAETGSAERFVALDAWRGIAALMVALYRLEADGTYFHLEIVRNAYLFVDFFFVLSGFVIAHAYSDRIADGLSAAGFVIRRIGRLWPLHLLMLGAFVGLEVLKGLGGAAVFQDHRAPWSLAADFFLVQGLGVTPWTDWNTPAWSISTEFWTYLIFAAVCLIGRRSLVPIAAALAFASLAILTIVSPANMDVTFGGYGMLRCVAGFFAGVVVYALYRRAAAAETGPRGSTTLAEAAAVTAMIAFVWASGRGSLGFAAPIVFGLGVFVFAFERGAISRVLTAAPFRLMGELSYSIYMTAFFIALAFNIRGSAFAERYAEVVRGRIDHDGHSIATFAFGPPGAMDGLALIYLGVVVAVSFATYRLVEDPARRLANRIAKGVETGTGRARQKIA